MLYIPTFYQIYGISEATFRTKQTNFRFQINLLLLFILLYSEHQLL